ncbi:MAG: hypothetical protein V7637_3516, partial [Mycobacteriales bacterium]
MTGGEGRRAPRVFISYAWGSGVHERLVDAPARTGVHADLLALARARPVAAQPATLDEITPLLDVFWHAV